MEIQEFVSLTFDQLLETYAVCIITKQDYPVTRLVYLMLFPRRPLPQKHTLHLIDTFVHLYIVYTYLTSTGHF